MELAKIHPLGALLSAWSYFEKTMAKFYLDAGLNLKRKHNMVLNTSIGHLERLGINVPTELQEKLNVIRKVRNMSAHGRMEPSLKQVKETIVTIEILEKHLFSLNFKELQEKSQAVAEKEDAERLKRQEECEFTRD